MPPLLRALPLVMIAGACAAPSSGPPRITLSANTCDTGAPPAITGMNVGEVFAGTGQRMVIVPPGITPPADYRSGRLVVFVDDKGWIQRAECR
ncbi:MAG: hypothetical protein Q4G22_10650 [Paracoccus sp. (in: a-proteobacteria)]|uniref:hypothetical protein n=1 Tax=Paracoccus sp. TaxID=267 RepID=UPI0026DEB14C|nr:hypothetical protein [Paracoccus sp. (in: a-proteobacteria)]MDO5632285.1 hypothetical protein [Paracoccus sp. (in: a-proteobacteria)]